jgi:hypothetical protein
MAPGRRAGILVLAVLLLGTGRGRAQERSDAGPLVSLKQHAAALARAGWQSQDARVILAAAQLLMLLDRGAGGIRRVQGGESLPPDWDVPTPFDASGLLRLASEVAVDRQDRVTAEVAATLARAELGITDTALSAALGRAAAALAGVRGAVGAPRVVEGFLKEGETAEYAIPFEGGGVVNHVTVSLSAERGSLSCYLYDDPAAAPNRSARRAAEDRPGGCGLTWRQESPGEVTLRIRNAGPAAYFVLLTN